MSAAKLPTAQEYVRSNYVETGRLRYDLLSQKLQIKGPFRPPLIRSVENEELNRTKVLNDEMMDWEHQHESKALWQDLDTRWINTMAVECANETGVSVSDKEIRIVLNSHVVPAINPLRDWLQSLPEYTPSKSSFIDWLSSQVHVKELANEELNRPNGLNDELMSVAQERWRVCFRKWFVAMVASWMQDEVVNQQVLVLIGKQGIYKTTWLEHLMPPCLRAYCTKMANVRDLNKDERMRIAEFCASGNKREFLTDQTGNRRWLPFEVESIESPYNWGNSFPYEQIYAEALYLLRNGFEYWFELPDIEAMESHVESFHVESNEEQLLPVYFQPANPGDNGAVFMSAAEISSLLVSYGNIRKPLAINKLSTLLQKSGYEPRRTRTKRGYVVYVIKDLDEQRKLDARAAFEKESMRDAGDTSDTVF